MRLFEFFLNRWFLRSTLFLLLQVFAQHVRREGRESPGWLWSTLVYLSSPSGARKRKPAFSFVNIKYMFQNIDASPYSMYCNFFYTWKYKLLNIIIYVEQVYHNENNNWWWFINLARSRKFWKNRIILHFP